MRQWLYFHLEWRMLIMMRAGKNRGFVCTIGAIILIGIPALIKKWFGL